jgi:hypothetical protein
MANSDVMSHEAAALTPEFAALIRRGIARMHDSHVHDLSRVLNDSLSLIHPNQRRTGLESLETFTAKTVEALNKHLSSVQEFVLVSVGSTNTLLTEERVKELVTLVRAELHPELYRTRFEGYESSFSRHVARYGATIKLSDFRPDLAKAALHAGTSNRITRFCDELKDALLTVLERQRNTAPTAERPPESVIDQGNRFIKLEPNVFGIGFNFNYLIRRLRGKRE